MCDQLEKEPIAMIVLPKRLRHGAFSRSFATVLQNYDIDRDFKIDSVS